MRRMTLRLPDTLHDALARRAEAEGVSMNQFLVYALSRATPLDDLAEQRAAFQKLRTRFPKKKAEAALSELLRARSPG
ncbi:MAG: toxin-antitoxin system HicB family antitoxin [Planctomycetes bacterium]|nr:toxin-antitoxin system HicB family antitoxin [Planctomycetota bacterium]